MLDILLKQIMPADFDMEKATQAIAAKAQEISILVQVAKVQQEQISALQKQAAETHAAVMALVYKFEPDARPIEGWGVKNGKTGVVHLSGNDPRPLISGEEIAENELDIYPVFKL